MKHATLYRKWRPRRFGAIVGQEPVVRTLRRAIETDRVAHAYLFSGPRGTGKTSTAKVLAMGLNCVQGPTPEPDGTCESCRAIMNSSSMDVLEMDAASNRGIDEIRELRDRVNLAPASGRMKVYIIDEVHMLTAEAFNALLKMLEEPPEHVIFVLATTEKHKVLPTIISRCQSFDFRRPGVDTLSEKLAEIAAAEDIETEPEALTIIAREGKGSFRDAEGLLDQLSSFADGPITASMVRELLGSVGSEALLETTAALYERRVAEALKVVDRLSNEGRDLAQFVAELIRHLRVLMLLPHAPEVALAEVGADERAALEAQAEAIPTAEVVRILEALGDTSGRIKRGGDTKLELELTFLKLVRDYTEPSVDALLSRLESLENAVASGEHANVARHTPSSELKAASMPESMDLPVQGDTEGSEEFQEKEPEAVQPPERQNSSTEFGELDQEAENLDEAVPDWELVRQDLLKRRKALAEAIFRDTKVLHFSRNLLELEFPKELERYADTEKKSSHVEELNVTLEKLMGTRPRLEFRVSGEQRNETNNYQDGALSKDKFPPKPAQRDPAVESEMSSQPDPGPPDFDTSAPEPSDTGNGGDQARSTGSAESTDIPETGGSDDTIGSVQEVFAIVRDRFGSSNDNGGG